MLVRLPEITTFRPAVDGSGEEAIVNAPDAHWVAQQAVVQHGVVQHGVVQQAVVQQADVVEQQVAVDGQHTVAALAPSADCGGVGQHGMIIPRSRCWGQTMCGVLPAAPAGLSITRTHSEAARQRSDDGMIRRRIADNRRTDYPHL